MVLDGWYHVCIPAYASQENSKDINACVNYCMRYAGHPAMAESHITKYSKEEGIVEWFYHDHEDEKRYDVKEPVINFVQKLIIYILDEDFRNARYYGFYSNASSKEFDIIHDLLGEKKKNHLINCIIEHILLTPSIETR